MFSYNLLLNAFSCCRIGQTEGHTKYPPVEFTAPTRRHTTSRITPRQCDDNATRNQQTPSIIAFGHPPRRSTSEPPCVAPDTYALGGSTSPCHASAFCGYSVPPVICRNRCLRSDVLARLLNSRFLEPQTKSDCGKTGGQMHVCRCVGEAVNESIGTHLSGHLN